MENWGGASAYVSLQRDKAAPPYQRSCGRKQAGRLCYSGTSVFIRVIRG